MRLIFPCCLLLLVLFGANLHAWGKVAVNPEPATANQVFIWVEETDPDAPPAGVSSGGWLSHDPTGFEDGPNVYAYCIQNPWSKFDPHGLAGDDPKGVVRKDHHVVPVQSVKKNELPTQLTEELEKSKVPAGKARGLPQHVFNKAHDIYNQRAGQITDATVEAVKEVAPDLGAGSAKKTALVAEIMVEQVSQDPYCKAFNEGVAAGKSGPELNKLVQQSDLVAKPAGAAGPLLKNGLRKLAGTIGAFGIGLTMTSAANAQTQDEKARAGVGVAGLLVPEIVVPAMAIEGAARGVHAVIAPVRAEGERTIRQYQQTNESSRSEAVRTLGVQVFGANED